MQRTLLLLISIILLSQFSLSENLLETGILAIPSFTNRTDSKDYDWLSEALADMLTTDIAASKKIMVVNRVEMKKILDEQRLALNGLVQDSKIQIGQIVGANLILNGSFTIFNDIIRIDVQIINEEEGTTVGTTSVAGDIQNYFLLQKRLSLKTFDVLKIPLSEEEQITLSQADSKNPKAIENNYKGILALENKNLKAAENYFSQAVFDKRDEIEEKFKGNGPLGRFIADLKLLFQSYRITLKASIKKSHSGQLLQS